MYACGSMCARVLLGFSELMCIDVLGGESERVVCMHLMCGSMCACVCQ